MRNRLLLCVGAAAAITLMSLPVGGQTQAPAAKKPTPAGRLATRL